MLYNCFCLCKAKAVSANAVRALIIELEDMLCLALRKSFSGILKDDKDIILNG